MRVFVKEREAFRQKPVIGQWPKADPIRLNTAVERCSELTIEVGGDWSAAAYFSCWLVHTTPGSKHACCNAMGASVGIEGPQARFADKCWRVCANTRCANLGYMNLP